MYISLNDFKWFSFDRITQTFKFNMTYFKLFGHLNAKSH